MLEHPPKPADPKEEPKYCLITEQEVSQLCFRGAGLTQEEQTNLGIRILHRPITTNGQHIRNLVRGIVKVIKAIFHAIKELVDEINEPPKKKDPPKKNGKKPGVNDGN